MLTPRHASVAQLLDMRKRLADIYAAEGLDRARVAIAPLRHVCITGSKAEAQDFIDNVRHQIRLSQSLRFREELIDGVMLVEKPYRNEPASEELAKHVLVGDGNRGRTLGRARARGAPQAHAAALPGRRLAAGNGAAFH
jgi:hypothetical protein